MFSFQLGDSAGTDTKQKYTDLFENLEGLLDCKEEWVLILKDPLSNSFVMPTRDKIEDDPQLSVEDYDRTAEEDSLLGIDVLKAAEQSSS